MQTSGINDQKSLIWLLLQTPWYSKSSLKFYLSLLKHKHTIHQQPLPRRYTRWNLPGSRDLHPSTQKGRPDLPPSLHDHTKDPVTLGNIARSVKLKATCIKLRNQENRKVMMLPYAKHTNYRICKPWPRESKIFLVWVRKKLKKQPLPSWQWETAVNPNAVLLPNQQR